MADISKYKCSVFIYSTYEYVYLDTNPQVYYINV